MIYDSHNTCEQLAQPERALSGCYLVCWNALERARLSRALGRQPISARSAKTIFEGYPI